MKEKKCSSIGGQAVLEGVMMRGKSSMATAVRNSKGEIVVESSRFVPNDQKSVFYRIPIIRGVLNFVSSMASGVKTLNRSSEVFTGMENEEPSRFEKWLAKKFNIDIMSVLIFISLFIGLAMAIGLFVVLPHLATEGIVRLSGMNPRPIFINLIAGGVRIAIFVIYILLIGLMKDIKRLFRYHGAEHKVISCYEKGLELTVENAQKMTTVHDRCGTTFIFIIMVFSILFFSFDVFSQNFWQRILIRIVFIPLVAGISYELLKLFAKYDNVVTRILKFPGLLLQKLTTQPPEDGMVEVALKAFTTVMELEENPDKLTESFVTYTTVEKAVKELSDIVATKNEAELILMHTMGLKSFTELYAGKRVSSVEKQKAVEYAKQRIKGEPLQYVLGNACFYGFDFIVDKRTLIPRFDTEHIVKAAVELANTVDKPKILDLMTGSGAIAIAIKKSVDCEMTATDISAEALEVAKLNAKNNGCEITFLQGSIFEPVEGKHDIICCNPPYIPESDIASLDSEVKDYEPLTALNGGADGLDFYRKIASDAPKYLNHEGYLLLEAGSGQAEAIKELLGEGFTVDFVYDLNNPPIARVVVARLKNL